MSDKVIIPFKLICNTKSKTVRALNGKATVFPRNNPNVQELTISGTSEDLPAVIGWLKSEGYNINPLRKFRKDFGLDETEISYIKENAK